MEKIKNLPVMRFVAFAVALAIILGLSSIMLSLTASAETTNKDIKTGSFTITGKYDGYPCIDLGTELSFYDFVQNYNTFNYGFCVIPLVIKNNVTYFYKDNSSWNYYGYIDVYTTTSSNGGTVFNNGASFFTSSLSADNGESYKNYKTVIKATNKDSGVVYNLYKYDTNKSEWVLSWDIDYSMDFYDYKSNTYATNILPTDIKYVLVSNQSRFLQNKNRNNNWSDLDTIFSSSDYIGIDTLTAPKAEFVTCASYQPEDNTTIPLWFKDFTSEGQQYPLFTYYVHDNGNKHSYSLKLSYSESAKESVKKVFNLRENTPADSDSATKDLIERIVAMYALHGVKIHNLTPYLRTALNLKFPNNLIYNQSFVLSSPEMDFSATGDNKIYTICLSDYSDIIQCLIYKAEIIDNNTGLVLDTTYFTSKQTFNKGNSGFGSKVYDYGDKFDDMISDIKNNTPSVEPVKKDSFISDGDIISTNKHDYYSGLKIDDIFNSLESSASSLRAFFLLCMSIIPSGILTIILGGLSIVIVLRILGR